MARAASRRLAFERELAATRAERDDAQEALRAILAGEVDSVMVSGPAGSSSRGRAPTGPIACSSRR